MRVSLATAGSLVLLVSFFLPWITILGYGVAGHELHEIWKPGPYLFAIPVLAGLAFFMGLCGGNNVVVAGAAGGLTFVFLALAIYQFSADVFDALAGGAYLTLASSLFLLSVVPRLGRKDPPLLAPEHNTSIVNEHENRIDR